MTRFYAPRCRPPSERKDPEAKFHVAVARYLNLALPPDAFWTTIPTGNLSLTQGARMKAKGYQRGTPDIVVIWGGKAMWIELKAPNGVVSDDQRAVGLRLIRAGAKCGLARDLGQVEQFLQQQGIPLRATAGPPPRRREPLLLA